ncbi:MULTISPECIES: hypothetical protein [Streptomyces]|uniref:Uncharacterized protein n=1 Tax=Streptomyces lienomycini TaxID=284035 RepID=A0ABV9X5I3_9ACTN
MKTAATPRFEVYLSDDGLAEIDGERIVPEPGHAVQEAVLNRLQWLAQQHAAPVTATVNGSADTVHFVLEVLPDGSSRLIDDQTEEAPTPESEAAPVSAVAAVDAPVRSPDSSAVAAAIARARATATASRASTADRRLARAATGYLSQEHTAQLAHIHGLEAEGRVYEAFVGATALREALSASLGPEHAGTVEARAVEAYLAHLHGSHREATTLALGVARIRCRSGDEQAPADVARATAAWRRLDDRRALLTHGTELLLMWDALQSRDLLTPTYEELAQHVRHQVAHLSSNRKNGSTGLRESLFL